MTRSRRRVPPSVEVPQSSLFGASHRFREEFLAGLIVTWAYELGHGRSPLKADKEAARSLAAEMNERIEMLP